MTNWTAVGIVGTLVVSLVGSLFAFIQASRSNKSASTSRTIELGITQLIDQYQEANAALAAETAACKEECARLRGEIRVLRRQVEEFRTTIDNQEAEIIRLTSQRG